MPGSVGLVGWGRASEHDGCIGGENIGGEKIVPFLAELGWRHRAGCGVGWEGMGNRNALPRLSAKNASGAHTKNTCFLACDRRRAVDPFDQPLLNPGFLTDAEGADLATLK